MDGRIRLDHECQCHRCAKPALGLGGSIGAAKVELRHRGWTEGVDKDRTLRVWYCDECTLLGWAK